MKKEKLLEILSKYYKDMPKIIIEDIKNAIKIEYVLGERNNLLHTSTVRQKLTIGKSMMYHTKIIEIYEKKYLEKYGVFFIDIKNENRFGPCIIINPDTYEIIYIEYNNIEICDDYVPLIYTPPSKKQ